MQERRKGRANYSPRCVVRESQDLRPPGDAPGGIRCDLNRFGSRSSWRVTAISSAGNWPGSATCTAAVRRRTGTKAWESSSRSTTSSCTTCWRRCAACPSGWSGTSWTSMVWTPGTGSVSCVEAWATFPTTCLCRLKEKLAVNAIAPDYSTVGREVLIEEIHAGDVSKWFSQFRRARNSKFFPTLFFDSASEGRFMLLVRPRPWCTLPPITCFPSDSLLDSNYFCNSIGVMKRYHFFFLV